MFHNTFTCPPYSRNGKPRFVNNVTDQFRLNSDKQSQSDIILLCHADIIFFLEYVGELRIIVLRRKEF